MDITNEVLGTAKASKKDRAVAALMEHASAVKAAEAVGIHASTIWRWLKDPAFQKRLIEAQNIQFSQSMRCLQQAAPAATANLVRTMRDPTTPAHTRVRAIECILKVSQQTFQHAVLEQRVAELEKACSESQPRPKPDAVRKSNYLSLVPLLFLLLPLLPWLAARQVPLPWDAARTARELIDLRDVSSVDLPILQVRAIEDSRDAAGAETRANLVRAEAPFPFPPAPAIQAGPVPCATPLPGLAPNQGATSTYQSLPGQLPNCEARVRPLRIGPAQLSRPQIPTRGSHARGFSSSRIRKNS